MTKPKIERLSEPAERSASLFDDIDRVANAIRDRAYELFRQRDRADGRALDDWLSAEQELCWPSAELVENDEDYGLKMALAGYKPDEITVTATPRELVVKANHVSRRHKKRKDDEETVCWSEFRSNDVCRRIELPAEIDVDKVSAEFKNGLLSIEAPKAAATIGKDVEVSTAA